MCSVVGNGTLAICVIKSCRIPWHSVLVGRKDEGEAGAVTCAEDTKTFSLSGLFPGFIIFPDSELFSADTSCIGNFGRFQQDIV